MPLGRWMVFIVRHRRDGMIKGQRQTRGDISMAGIVKSDSVVPSVDGACLRAGFAQRGVSNIP